MIRYSQVKKTLIPMLLLAQHRLDRHFLRISRMIASGIIKHHYEVYLICKFPLLLAYTSSAYFDYRGPGAYNNEEKTTFRYELEHQPMSRRGYTLNARTEKRKTFVGKVIVERALL